MNKQRILNFVESVGGLERLQKALEAGATRIAEAQTEREAAEVALTEAKAEVNRLTKTSESLNEELTTARGLLASSVKQRRSGAVIAESVARASAPSSEVSRPASIAASLIN